MPEKDETRKKSRKCEKQESESENFRAGQKSVDDENAWSTDQQEKSYYYDDAYGYEIYNPEEDDEIESKE